MDNKEPFKPKFSPENKELGFHSFISFEPVRSVEHIKLQLDLITKIYDELEGTKFRMGT